MWGHDGNGWQPEVDPGKAAQPINLFITTCIFNMMPIGTFNKESQHLGSLVLQPVLSASLFSSRVGFEGHMCAAHGSLQYKGPQEFGTRTGSGLEYSSLTGGMSDMLVGLMTLWHIHSIHLYYYLVPGFQAKFKRLKQFINVEGPPLTTHSHVLRKKSLVAGSGLVVW